MKLRTLAALLVVAAASLEAQVSYERILNADREPHNWLSYSRTPMNQRFSPLSQITADNAHYSLQTAEHPAGYLLRGVRQPANLAQRPSISLNGRPAILSPRDTPWLEPDECFVPSVVTFEQLTVGGAWRQYLSSFELITGLRGETIEPGADVRLAIHARVVQPLLDLSLVLLGIPLVLSRGGRNIFLAAGLGGLLVGAMMIVTLVCHAVGSNYLLDATLAAWLPLLIFGPVAYTAARPLWD